MAILTWRKSAGGIVCRLILRRRGAKSRRMKAQLPVMDGAAHV
jgi:hypothetical protein